MGETIGEAFVRIRPSGLAAFKTETETGVKSAMLGVGKIIAGTLAIKGGFDFAKSIVGDAARVQKSAEVIRSEFGRAGKSIIDFADKGGIALGIASHTTEDTAARFGILFKNIGVGKDTAAGMTLNLEKLAGSIASIKGQKPEDVLGTLPLVLSGSLRGARQLGFSFTTLQEKNEALRLGLISTTKQALDPGAKAISIYGLLTKNLGDFQAQAKAHSGDLLNVERRLGAEYDHIKETLGTGLLPELAKYGTELSKSIDRGIKSGHIQRDLNTVTHDAGVVIKDVVGIVKTGKSIFDGFSKLVGGSAEAVKTLADAFLLMYARSKLIKWGVIETGITAIGTDSGVAAAKAGGLSRVLTGLKGLGPIALLIELDIIRKLPHGKEITDANASNTKKFLDDLQHADITKGSGWKKFGKDFGTLLIGGTPTSGSLIGKLFGIKAPKTIEVPPLPLLVPSKAGFAAENARLKKAGADLATSIAAGVASKDALVRASGNTALTALKSAAAVANRAAEQQLADAKYQVEQARQTLTDAIAASKTAVADSIRSAKQNLNSIAGSLAGDITSAGGAAPLTGHLAHLLKELQARIKSGKADTRTVSLATELQNQIAAKANLPGGTVGTQLADLADLFNKGALTGPKAKLRLDRILKSSGVDAAVIQRNFGVAAADQFRADKAGFLAQITATSAGPKARGSGLEVTIVKPLETLRAQQKIIAADQHALETQTLGVGRAALHVQQTQAAEARKQTALLAKIAAAQPSKHDTAELEALLRSQGAGNPTAANAAAAARGRHHR